MCPLKTILGRCNYNLWKHRLKILTYEFIRNLYVLHENVAAYKLRPNFGVLGTEILDDPGTALFGGNCNNGLNCGAFACNLNNTVGNHNWNIVASPSLTFYLADFSGGQTLECSVFS